MLLPTKGISAERAILTVGADVLEHLQTPKTVTALWEQCRAHGSEGERADHITFDWFSLALASLFAIRVVEWTPSGHLRRIRVS